MDSTLLAASLVSIISTAAAQSTLNDCIADGCPLATAAAVQCITAGDIALPSCQSAVCGGQAVSDFNLLCATFVPSCSDVYSNTYAAEFSSVAAACSTTTTSVPATIGPTSSASPLASCQSAGCPADVVSAVVCGARGEVYSDSCRSTICANGVWSRFLNECVYQLTACNTDYTVTYRLEMADVEAVCALSARPVTTSTTTTQPRDVVPPQLVSVSPLPGSVVTQRSTLVVEFQEDVRKGPRSILLVRTAPSDQVELGEGSWLRFSGRYLYITPPEFGRLAEGNDCFSVQIEFGSVLDVAGNPFGGFASLDFWGLCVVDRDGPRVKNVEEEVLGEDSIGVVIEFDETIVAAMTLVVTLTAQSDARQRSIPAEIGADQSSLVVTLDGLLLGERYRIDVPDRLVQDSLGNAFSRASFNGYSLQLPAPTTTPVVPTSIIDPPEPPNPVGIILCVLAGLLVALGAGFWWWRSKQRQAYIAPATTESGEAAGAAKVNRKWEASAVKAGGGVGFAKGAHLRAEDSKRPKSAPPPISGSETIDKKKVKDEATDMSAMEERRAREIASELLKELESIADEDGGERKKAHKKMCFTWHPDKNPEDLSVATEVFQWLQRQKEWFLEGSDQPSPRPPTASAFRLCMHQHQHQQQPSGRSNYSRGATPGGGGRRGGGGKGQQRPYNGHYQRPVLPIPQAGTYSDGFLKPSSAADGLLPSPAGPPPPAQQRTPHKKTLPPPTCLLTPEEQAMWASAPYACPACRSPFMKWSQCDTHILSSPTCQAGLANEDLKGQCEAFAAAHAGSLRPPPAPPVPRPPRKGSASGRSATGRGREGRQRVETEREIQAIKDEYEKAIFGGRRGSMSTVNGLTPSSAATAFSADTVTAAPTRDHHAASGASGPMDYHDLMGGADYASSGFGRVCLICQMGESSCALAPCGHMLACYSTLALQLRDCPCCGAHIHQLIQVCPVDIRQGVSSTAVKRVGVRHYHLNIFNGNGLQMNTAGGAVTIPRSQVALQYDLEGVVSDVICEDSDDGSAAEFEAQLENAVASRERIQRRNRARGRPSTAGLSGGASSWSGGSRPTTAAVCADSPQKQQRQSHGTTTHGGTRASRSASAKAFEDVLGYYVSLVGQNSAKRRSRDLGRSGPPGLIRSRPASAVCLRAGSAKSLRRPVSASSRVHGGVNSRSVSAVNSVTRLVDGSAEMAGSATRAPPQQSRRPKSAVEHMKMHDRKHRQSEEKLSALIEQASHEEEFALLRKMAELNRAVEADRQAGDAIVYKMLNGNKKEEKIGCFVGAELVGKISEDAFKRKYKHIMRSRDGSGPPPPAASATSSGAGGHKQSVLRSQTSPEEQKRRQSEIRRVLAHTMRLTGKLREQLDVSLGIFEAAISAALILNLGGFIDSKMIVSEANQQTGRKRSGSRSDMRLLHTSSAIPAAITGWSQTRVLKFVRAVKNPTNGSFHATKWELLEVLGTDNLVAGEQMFSLVKGSDEDLTVSMLELASLCILANRNISEMSKLRFLLDLFDWDSDQKFTEVHLVMVAQTVLSALTKSIQATVQAVGGHPKVGVTWLEAGDNIGKSPGVLTREELIAYMMDPSGSLHCVVRMLSAPSGSEEDVSEPDDKACQEEGHELDVSKTSSEFVDNNESAAIWGTPETEASRKVSFFGKWLIRKKNEVEAAGRHGRTPRTSRGGETIVKQWLRYCLDSVGSASSSSIASHGIFQSPASTSLAALRVRLHLAWLSCSARVSSLRSFRAKHILGAGNICLPGSMLTCIGELRFVEAKLAAASTDEIPASILEEALDACLREATDLWRHLAKSCREVPKGTQNMSLFLDGVVEGCKAIIAGSSSSCIENSTVEEVSRLILDKAVLRNAAIKMELKQPVGAWRSPGADTEGKAHGLELAITRLGALLGRMTSTTTVKEAKKLVSTEIEDLLPLVGGPLCSVRQNLLEAFLRMRTAEKVMAEGALAALRYVCVVQPLANVPDRLIERAYTDVTVERSLDAALDDPSTSSLPVSAACAFGFGADAFSLNPLKVADALEELASRVDCVSGLRLEDTLEVIKALQCSSTVPGAESDRRPKFLIRAKQSACAHGWPSSEGLEEALGEYGSSVPYMDEVWKAVIDDLMKALNEDRGSVSTDVIKVAQRHVQGRLRRIHRLIFDLTCHGILDSPNPAIQDSRLRSPLPGSLQGPGSPTVVFDSSNRLRCGRHAQMAWFAGALSVPALRAHQDGDTANNFESVNRRAGEAKVLQLLCERKLISWMTSGRGIVEEMQDSKISMLEQYVRDCFFHHLQESDEVSLGDQNRHAHVDEVPPPPELHDWGRAPSADVFNVIEDAKKCPRTWEILSELCAGSEERRAREAVVAMRWWTLALSRQLELELALVKKSHQHTDEKEEEVTANYIAVVDRRVKIAVQRFIEVTMVRPGAIGTRAFQRVEELIEIAAAEALRSLQSVYVQDTEHLDGDEVEPMMGDMLQSFLTEVDNHRVKFIRRVTHGASEGDEGPPGKFSRSTSQRRKFSGLVVSTETVEKILSGVQSSLETDHLYCRLFEDGHDTPRAAMDDPFDLELALWMGSMSVLEAVREALAILRSSETSPMEGA
ncbi:hypothetical protein FOL47_000911 [Perkinsus chesapeaki]|uniref:Uncharacterized protein n=1 Tax=Perkinsus chesapeaki TaxID=330153 RepID=A0A7J6N0W6_PERCH|nr:hypothetical protein FOL47_000911 [Perkinsus chesapeaki]